MQYDIGRIARLMQRLRSRPRQAETSKARQVVDLIVLPTLQVSLVGQNQIGHGTGLVEERRETNDEWNLLEGRREPFLGWMIGERVGGE